MNLTPAQIKLVIVLLQPGDISTAAMKNPGNTIEGLGGRFCMFTLCNHYGITESDLRQFRKDGYITGLRQDKYGAYNYKFTAKLAEAWGINREESFQDYAPHQTLDSNKDFKNWDAIDHYRETAAEGTMPAWVELQLRKIGMWANA